MVQYIGINKKWKTYGEVNDKVYLNILEVGRHTMPHQCISHLIPKMISHVVISGCSGSTTNGSKM